MRTGDFFDARARGGDQLSESCQAAGTIAHHGGKAAQSAVGDQSFFDHAREDQRIDVAAGENEHGSQPGQLGELAGHRGRQGRGAGPLDDAFFQFHEPQHRQR